LSKKTTQEQSLIGDQSFASLEQMIEEMSEEMAPAQLITIVLNTIWRRFTDMGMQRSLLLMFLLQFTSQLAEMEVYREQQH
jgi:dipeptide/tripeptide permease